MYQTWNPSDRHNPTLGDLCRRGYTVFDDTWDTYVKEHKQVLCDKIVRYYYFYEIGSETPDRFIHYLNEQLARIMPYYNQLYRSELIEFNPMLNHAITSNGRSIENLLKSLSTDTSRTGKMLRDAVNKATGYGDSTAKTGVKSTENVDKTVKTVYNKDGTDDSTTDTTENTKFNEHVNTVSDYTRDRVLTEDTNYDGNIDDTGHSVTVVDGTKVTDTDKSIDIVVDGVTKDTDTGTIVDDGVGTSKSNGTKDWEEVTDDTAKTVVVTDLGEKTTGSGRKDYADTPQIQLTTGGTTGSGATGMPQVRSDYLTNVTWDYSTSNHELDSTVTTDFKDDITKTHTEKTSDNTDTTDKNTKTTNMVKDGTSKTTTNHSEDNTENEKTDSTTTGDTTNNKAETYDKTVDVKEDIADKTVTNQDTDSNKDVTGKTVYDDDWTEKGNEDEVTKQVRVGVSDTLANTQTKDTRDSRETESQESGGTSLTKEDTQRTVDTGTTDITTGFMNIPSSALLDAFRKTFLNIDQMIIEELVENFSVIF